MTQPLSHEPRSLVVRPHGAPLVLCSCGEIYSSGLGCGRPYTLAHNFGLPFEEALGMWNAERTSVQHTDQQREGV